MIQRSTKIFLEVLIGLVVLALVPTAILLWRLSQGPVELDFLTPYIEDAFEAAVPNSRVTVGTTQLQWPGWSHSIDLQASNIGFLDLDGQIGVDLPEVSLKLSARALFQGVVAPTSVRIRDASIYLVREKDGRIHLEFAAQSSTGHHPAGDSGLGIADLLTRLVPDPSVERPLTLLNHVQVVDSRILVVDEKLDRVWSFPLMKLELTRADEGIDGNLAFGIDASSGAAAIDTAFHYDKKSAALDFAASFESLMPEILAETFPDLEFLRAVDMPLAGALTASLSSDETLNFAEFSLSADAGKLILEDSSVDHVAFRSAEVVGQYDREKARLELENFVIQLDTEDGLGPEVRATGGLAILPEMPEEGLEGELRVMIDRVRMDDLSVLWPGELSV